MKAIISHAACIIIVALSLVTARADTQTWSTTTGDWFIVDNWTNTTDPGNTRVPSAGDDVMVTNAAALVYLTNTTPWLSSLLISNATMSCSNWDTLLSATNITIKKSGVITCEGPFTNNAVTNRLSLNCSNLFIETDGAINLNGKGFSGGINSSGIGFTNTYSAGHGPGGGGTGQDGGASHGGAGGYGDYALLRSTSTVYGSATAPLNPGSGGKAGNLYPTVGGCGGGAVCITAVQVVVNGSILANATLGTGPTRASGGSGGSIYISCVTLTGTNGTISANGSSAASFNASSANGGGGGGGRIALLYDQSAQALLPVPSIRFSAAAGMGGFVTNFGDIGTLYLSDNYFFSPTNLFTGQWLAPGDINVSISDWMVSNTWTRLAVSSITVTNTLTVAGTNFGQFKLEVTTNATINCGQVRISGASLILGYNYHPNAYLPILNLSTSGPTMNCSGDLTLTNNSRFYILAGLTNSGAATGYGARVSVGGNIRVATNCWISPIAHSTNGAVVLFSMRNITIDRGGGINADILGYGGGLRVSGSAGNPYGPGSVPYNGGAGYGGAGSAGSDHAGGPAYGFSNAPVDPGSGAAAGTASGSANGPFGGGSVQIRATDSVSVKGMITANGGVGSITYGPGSSGGGIYITCRSFTGDSNAILSANGGNFAYRATAAGGGGGGGRIAVWRIFDYSSSVISNYVNPGVGYGNTSAPGTIVWGSLLPPNCTIVTIY